MELESAHATGVVRARAARGGLGGPRKDALRGAPTKDLDVLGCEFRRLSCAGVRGIRVGGTQQDFGSQSLIHNLPRAVEWTAGAAPDNTTSYDEISRSYFALAAAGDVWASGRVLEALTLNAVPVVDKTYATDGGRSAKGCADPASFWESGLGVESPAVFVSDWAQLAPTLTKAGALDADQRDERVARVQPSSRGVVPATRSAAAAISRAAPMASKDEKRGRARSSSPQKHSATGMSSRKAIVLGVCAMEKSPLPRPDPTTPTHPPHPS